MMKTLAFIITGLFVVVVLIFAIGGLLTIPRNQLIGGFIGLAITIILIWAITVVENVFSNRK